MWGEGIKSGKFAMIVLHETLKILGINHSIITHNSDGHHQSNIRIYQDFREGSKYKLERNYSLADIYANGGNCDSGALHFMTHKLLKTHNKDKICLIFVESPQIANES